MQKGARSHLHTLLLLWAAAISIYRSFFPSEQSLSSPHNKQLKGLIRGEAYSTFSLFPLFPAYPSTTAVHTLYWKVCFFFHCWIWRIEYLMGVTSSTHLVEFMVHFRGHLLLQIVKGRILIVFSISFFFVIYCFLGMLGVVWICFVGYVLFCCVVLLIVSIGILSL